MIPTPYDHQKYSTEFLLNHPRVFDASDAGTGKTRAHLDAYAAKPDGRMLVVCTKTIMAAAWANDILKFDPHLSFALAYANVRKKSFDYGTDIVVVNHDGINWVAENPDVLKGFNTIVIDESTAFKHHTSMRSRNARKVVQEFEFRRALTGTPTANGVLDIWHQMLLIDDGERLGNSFYKFRLATCNFVQQGRAANHGIWVDKPGAEEAIADLMSDITIRHRFADCIDIPEHSIHYIPVTLNNKHRTAYDTMRTQQILQLTSGETLTAVQTVSLRTKLLQMLSGAVYHDTDSYVTLDTDRYDLIMDLVEERKQSLVAFMWKHQRDNLIRLAKNRNIRYGLIDGSVTHRNRTKVVEAFQNGDLKVIFAQPASAGHGLTLTAGTSTIWASPTDNPEHFIQFNARVPRAGQTQKTETILIYAEDTPEEVIYQRLHDKQTRLDNLLELLQ